MHDVEIHPGHRLDVVHLRQFIPYLTIDQFRDVCNRKIDVVFRTRQMTPYRRRSIESEIGMEISYEVGCLV